jgi:hypothetical protein
VSPSIPLSRFVDEETLEPSAPTQPTVQPAEDPTDWGALSPQELHAQLCAQLECDSLPFLDPTYAWQFALETSSAEMLRSKQRDALERRAKANPRTIGENLFPSALSRNNESRPKWRPRTAWAKEYQRLNHFPYPPEFYAFTCRARTRAGTPCKIRPDYPNGRCKFHGGASTGPKTEQGRQQSAENGRKGGRPRKRVIDQEPKT